MPQKFHKVLAVALKPEWSFLKQELKIRILSKEHQLYTMLDSQNIGLLQIGMGSENAQTRLEKFFQDFSCISMLNFGSCGALNPGFRTGDLFLAHNISSILLTDSLEKYLKNTETRYHFGNLFSSHKIISSPVDKKYISHNFYCDAADMEAATIAQLCIAHKTELLCVKAIFDEFNEDLSDFGNVNLPNGDLDGTQLTVNLLKSPKLILKLPSLKEKMGRVAKSLTPVVRWYLEKSV